MTRDAQLAMRLAMGVLLTGWSTPSRAQLPPRQQSPYQRLSRQKLARTLQKLQMGTLLEELANQTKDDSLLVEALLFRADSAPADQRDELLVQAAELVRNQYMELEKTIEETRRKNSDAYEQALINYYKTRLRYVEIQALRRGKPFIDRLLMMMGGKEDRKALLVLTGEAVKSLDNIEQKLQRILSDSRRQAELQVYLVLELEDIRDQLEFSSAKVRYYSAISRPRVFPDKKTNQQRLELLRRATRDIQKFTEKADYGVQGYARLLQARCYREQEQFEKAAEMLDSAVAGQSRKEVLIEALFEVARNKIEQAALRMRDKENENRVQTGNEAFDEARKAVDAFAVQARKVHPQLGVDIKTFVLRHYLYERWAAALRSAEQAAQAEEYDKNTRQAFLEFLEKYKDPAIRAAVGKLFREKLRGGKINLQTTDPVIVLLLATLELNEADDLQDERDWNDLSQAEKDRIRRREDRAREMFEHVRKNSPPTARNAVASALWNLGVIHVKQMENFKAAEMFRELVSRFPKHKQAYTAALNAVKITSALIGDLVERGKPISRRRRIQFVESLRGMLDNWGDKPEAARYHFDLAWQCEKLSQNTTEQKAREWTTEAIENYEKVPADSALHQWARFEALELRYRGLLKQPDGQEKIKEARNLSDAMIRYGSVAHDLWREATLQSVAGPEKNDFGRWGSTSEYHAEIIAYEILGLKDEGLLKIEKLPDRWSGTAILRECRQFAIRCRLEKGDVQEALRQFEQFQKKYGRTEAQELMQEITEKLRKTIQDLVKTDRKSKQLQQFRRAYLAFAGQIYNTKIKSAAGAEKYYLTVLYADALTQSDTEKNAALALKLYEELAGTDERRRTERLRKIDADFAGLLEEVADAGERIEAVRKLDDALYAAMRGYKVENWKSSYLTEVRDAFGELDNGEGNRADPVRRAADAVARAYEKLREQVRRNVSVNANLILGLGRSYKTLKQYQKAIDEYRKLDAALNPNDHHDLYWEVQLELAESIFELCRNDPGQLRRLIIRINQLRLEAPELGGRKFLGQFNRIDADARRIVKKTE